MTMPRPIVPGACVAMTRRTVLRKAFVGWWDRRVDACWLYAMADAQRRTGMRLHHAVRVVNHQHVSGTAARPNLPEFLRWFHGETSCALNQVMTRRKIDAPGQLWDGRQPHFMRLMDAEAQAAHLVYERLNPVAAGLVARPEDVPGWCFDWGLWRPGAYVPAPCPGGYFDRRRRKDLRLVFTPPAELLAAFGGDHGRLIYAMRQMTEHGIRQLRRARTRAVRGPERLQRVHPWSEPRTLAARTERFIPSFKFGRTAGATGRRIAGAKEIKGFRERHEEARKHRLAGKEHRFPYGTYQMRVLHNAPVETEPPNEARVTRPGPTHEDLEETKSDIERTLLESARKTLAESLHKDVNQTRKEAAAKSNERHAGAVHTSETRAADEPDDAPGPPAAQQVQTQTRFDNNRHVDPSTWPRRIVVLRDRRDLDRGSSDPPA